MVLKLVLVLASSSSPGNLRVDLISIVWKWMVECTRLARVECDYIVKEGIKAGMSSSSG